MVEERIYSTEEKYLAAVHYYQYHNYSKLERDLNIPASTVKKWAKQIWWDDLSRQVIKDFDEEVRSRGVEIIRKAQKEIMDRLENGDATVTKNGDVIRKPVALRDALFTFLTSFDKNRIINLQPISQNGGVAFQQLQKQLEELGKKVGTKESPDESPEVPTLTKEGI